MRRFFVIVIMALISAVTVVAQESNVPFNGLVIDGTGKGIARMRVDKPGGGRCAGIYSQGSKG